MKNSLLNFYLKIKFIWKNLIFQNAKRAFILTEI